MDMSVAWCGTDNVYNKKEKKRPIHRFNLTEFDEE